MASLARPSSSLGTSGPSTSTGQGKTVFRILLSSSGALTHIRSVCDIGELLAKAGHYVTLAHRTEHRVLALEYGFNFIELDEGLFECLRERSVDWIVENLDKFHAQDHRMYSNWKDEDRETFSRLVYEFNVTDKAINKVLMQLAKSYDLFVADFETRYPATYFSPLPYIPVYSMNPLPLYINGPPIFSGYPTNLPEDDAKNFRISQRKTFALLYEKLETWWRSNGLPALRQDYWFVEEPRHFGVYRYLEALDYKECGPKYSDNWIRIDPDFRKYEPFGEPYKIPRSILFLPGKVIYLNLGSLGSVEIEWMVKFIKILEKIPHRFLVNKGPASEHFQLGRNMCGSKKLDQSSVLGASDLVITHGGCNSIMEFIYRQKPLIVLPFFLDQYDNAQRVVECGIGRRLNTWALNEEIVMGVINEVINDKTIPVKLAEISQQMRASDSRQVLVEKMESLMRERRAAKAAAEVQSC